MFKQSGGKELVRVSFLLLVFLIIFGCTHAIPLKGTMETIPVTERVPLELGIYYSPDFRNYKHVGSRGGDKWDFPLGNTSVVLFDRVFSGMFASARSVDSLPPFSAPQGKLDAVLEPKIESFDFALPFLKTGAYTAEITYRFTLYSLSGDQIASWTVRGSGSKHGQVGFEFARWPGEAADMAMQDAATKFMTGFSDHPEVRRLVNQTRRPSPK
jgi:hypothetical protein